MSDTILFSGDKGLSLGRSRALRNTLLLLVFLFFGFLLHWYQPNMGGSGLALPVNIITWMTVCVFMVMITVWPLSSGRFRLKFSAASVWFVSGFLILILLSLCTKPVWRENAALTTIGMVGSVFFYLTLLQFRVRPSDIWWMMTAVLLGVVLECILCLVQYFHLPAAQWWEFSTLRSARPYGIFQQINVLASFVATGVSALLFLSFSSPYQALLSQGRFALYHRAACFCLFTLFGLVLQLCQSQIGYLATGIALLCYCCWFYRQAARLLWIATALVLGILIGKLMQFLMMTPDINHIQSTHIRWVFIVDSLRMFIEKPLFGWGVGGFEYSFLHRFGGEETFVAQGTSAHPHNEILLWMVEGGSLALLAMAAIIIGGGIIVRLAYRRKRLPLLAVAFPVLLHMMTEYPIYQSAVHWLMLLIVLRCIDIPCRHFRIWPSLICSGRVFTGAAAAVFLILLAGAMQLQGKLTEIERGGRQDALSATAHPVGKILLSDRYNFDQHIGNLLRFNQSGDSYWLINFEQWARRYSGVHPDANIYDTRINIARQLNDVQHRLALQKEARWLFPRDPRFTSEH